jgi:hypothetical protein
MGRHCCERKRVTAKGRRRTILYRAEIGSSGWFADIDCSASAKLSLVQDGAQRRVLKTNRHNSRLRLSGL